MATFLLSGLKFKTYLTMHGVLDLDIVDISNIFRKAR